MKLGSLSKPVLGIGVEILYTLTIMLVAFIICLALSIPQ
jgi:hypothetical protein